MARRRMINGVLQGFLGNLVSRYCAFDGYWLIGFLAAERRSLEIDLLRGSRTVDRTSPEQVLGELAARKFVEQVHEWKLPLDWVADARLDVTWSNEEVDGYILTAKRAGYEATFRATVTTDLGRTLARKRCVFAVPHDPYREMRSARAG